MNLMTPKFGMGASVLRKEDGAFITGKGNYTDDIGVEGAAWGYVLRSPVANAKITMVSTDAAREAPGVLLVLTGADLGHLGDLKSTAMFKQPDGTLAPTRDIPILCRDQVRHVGDAVAFVVADTLNHAQDASELMEIEYDQLDAVADTARALDADAPKVWPEAGSNRAFDYHFGDAELAKTAFEAAERVSRVEFVNNRLVCNYMETRAAIGQWVAGEDRLVLTTGGQGVHGMRNILAERVFRIDADKLRVITPDVGGGFGTKAFVYREHVLVLEAARQLNRPVRWNSDRSEHFLADAHGRDNVVVAEMAMDAGQRFTGLRVSVKANMGAYISQFGAVIPWMGGSMSTGVYDIGAIDVSITGVYTNTCQVDAYRGAGRPEAALLIEKLVDQCARDTGLAPHEIRRRNFIRPDQFPYRTKCGRTYDVGEFQAHMEQAMEQADWSGFAERLALSQAQGKIRGIGMATYIEACAFAGSEPAHIELNTDGSVTILIGTQTNGQGHETAYAQLVADTLGLDMERIRMHQGDTDCLAKGGGTGGSRSIPLGGISVARAGEDLAERIRRIAADEMEASVADIELDDGTARIVGTDRALSYAQIAGAAKTPEDIKGFGEYTQDEATYPNGTHICEIEIDPQTGHSEITNYTIVDDFGATVNPVLLQGQVHGGAVQGIGQCLMEGTVFDDEAQLISASFMDYAMPRAADVPLFHFETRNVPSTTNEMGIKGAGEAGTIGAGPAVLNAVTNALYEAYGISHIEMPTTPERIWNSIRQACDSA